jgi:hypothetical protein
MAGLVPAIQKRGALSQYRRGWSLPPALTPRIWMAGTGPAMTIKEGDGSHVSFGRLQVR